MTPLILFSGMVLIIILIVFGVFLSSNIENSQELLLFWMLYVITIITILTLFCGFYVNMILKDKSGLVGEKGDSGVKGGPGSDGKCEANCRNEICFNTILEAIEERITELKSENFKDNQDLIDYLRFLNSIRFRDDTGNIVVLNENTEKSYIKTKILDKIFKNMAKEGNSNKNEVKIKTRLIEFLFKSTSEEYKQLMKDAFEKNPDRVIFRVNNLYIKGLIKRICHSEEFKEVSAIKGPQYLIEYIKDIMLKWVDLIYERGGKLYFKTIGAENDFDWVASNPFDEIKKYDLFYWGAPKSTRPRLIPVVPQYGKKIEYSLKSNQKATKNIDAFTNPEGQYEHIRMPELGFEKKSAYPGEIPDKTNKNDKSKRLKLLVSNDYEMSYNSAGTGVKTSMTVFRPRKKYHQGEVYYPLGDVAVGDGEPSFENDKFVFGPWVEKGETEDKVKLYLHMLINDTKLYNSRPGKVEDTNNNNANGNANTSSNDDENEDSLFIEGSSISPSIPTLTPTPVPTPTPTNNYNREELDMKDIIDSIENSNIIFENGKDKEFVDKVKEKIQEFEKIKTKQEAKGVIYSSSNGRTVGPQRSTILVAGDVKKPIRYERKWYDKVVKMWRHRPRGFSGFGRGHERFGHYKGAHYKIECPENYVAIGSTFGSSRYLNQPKFNQVNSGMPIGNEFEHVCIPKDCVEPIKSLPAFIWSTLNANRNAAKRNAYVQEGSHGGSLADVTVGMYPKAPEGVPTHNNKYNLLDTDLDGITTNMRIKSSCISVQHDFDLNGDDKEWPTLLKEYRSGGKNENTETYFIEDPSTIIDDLRPTQTTDPANNIDNSAHKDEINDFITSMENEFKREKKIINTDTQIQEDIRNYIFNSDELDVNRGESLDNYINQVEVITENIRDELAQYNESWRLKNPDAPYVNQSYLELIGFLDSLPDKERYSRFKKEAREIRKDIDRNLIAQKLFTPEDMAKGIKIEQLGLGWEKTKRKPLGLGYIDTEDNNKFKFKFRDYSMHNFFYIPSEGSIVDSRGNNLLKFKRESESELGEYELYKLSNLSDSVLGNYKFKLTGNKPKTNDVKLKNNMEIRIIRDLDKTEDTQFLVRTSRGRYTHKSIEDIIKNPDGNPHLFYIKNKGKEKSSE